MCPSATAVVRSAILGAGIFLAGCASTPQLDAQWTAPELGSHSALLRGAKVVVACDAFDVAIRQVCQQQLAAEVAARGATPVLAPAETPLRADRSIDSQLLPMANGANARAVLVVTLVPATTDTSSGFSLGIGGFGFGRNSAVGGGVALPVGAGRIETGFSANGRITDAQTGKLVWTASAAAAPSSDLAAQFAALSRAILDSAGKAGLF